jgi:large subunit ribosomal protein L6
LSRIGKKPIAVPSGVTVTRKGNILEIKGPMGVLTVELLGGIDIEIGSKDLKILNTGGELKVYKSRHGLLRTLISNAVTGVSKGFVKKLELVGVGYKVDAKGDGLDLNLGFSHPVFMKYPEGIHAVVEKGSNVISVHGIDKQKIGQYCANVRKLKPPEPYKGKGFRYEGEHVRRKSGKTV